MVRLVLDGERDRRRGRGRAGGLARRPDAARGGRRARRATRRRRARERDRAGLQRRRRPRTDRRRDERGRRQRRGSVAGRPRRDRGHAPALDRSRGARLGAGLLLSRGRDCRAGDVSPTRSPARDARRSRSVPRRDRAAVRGRLCARGDAESVHALQRELSVRAAARVRAPCGCGAAGDRPLRADRRASAAARFLPAPSIRRRTSPTCSPGSIRVTSSGSGSHWASRRRRRRAPRQSVPGWRSHAAPRARRRASSAAVTTATSSSGTA